MANLFQKRTNDLFVSYARLDTEVVEKIVHWLRRFAGLKVYFGGTGGDSGEMTTTLLSRSIGDARGSLFVLSSNWPTYWCKAEYEYSLTQKRENEEFLVVAIRIDDTDIPNWFKTSNVIDFRSFDLRSAADLLRSLSTDPPNRLDNGTDVYLAAPWSGSQEAAKPVLSAFRDTGWRLVGDSKDHPDFKDATARITSIIATTRGLVALLLFDSARPNNTSPWILKEAMIAKQLGKPFLLVAQEGVEVPADLASCAFGGRTIAIPKKEDTGAFLHTLSDFDEELSRRPHDDMRAYSFFAGSLREAEADTEHSVRVLERATNMTCVRGISLLGQHVQAAIVERISNAGFVIADVSEDNRNTLIEAGIALGAKTSLYLVSRPPANGTFKARFMFQDKEMYWYQDSVERLGSIYRIGRLYRRKVYGRLES